jgi:hypothetical protein
MTAMDTMPQVGQRVMAVTDKGYCWYGRYRGIASSPNIQPRHIGKLMIDCEENNAIMCVEPQRVILNNWDGTPIRQIGGAL